MVSTARAPHTEVHQTGTWDPLVRPVAVVALAVLFLLNSGGIGAIDGVNIPNTVPLLGGLGALGIAFLIPRPEPIMIPIAPSLLVVMLVLSVGWSHDSFNAVLWLRSDGLVLIGIVALCLVLPNRDVIDGLKLFVATMLLITLLAVIVDPLARTHIDLTGGAPELPGWHGWFIHKNTMAGFMVLALPVVMAFFRNYAIRWTGYGLIAVLIVGSDSTTGRLALGVQIAARLWFSVNRRLTTRGSATFVVSTVALVFVAIGAAISSLAALADAAGKDLTFTGRTEIWAAVLDRIAEHPIFGFGVKGLFAIPHTPETMQTLRQIGFDAGHAHNGLLDVAIQLGLIGVVLVVVLMVGLFRSSLREMRRAFRVPMFGLTLATGIVVLSVGESALLDSTVAVVFCAQMLVLRSARASERALVVRAQDSGRDER